MKPIGIEIRPVNTDDAQALLEIHHSAVHGLAADSYQKETLADWSKNVTPEAVAKERANLAKGGAYRVIARVEGRPVGFGALNPEKAEVVAVYVRPEYARQGLGAKLLDALEAEAKQLGLVKLNLDSSLNAEDFYRAKGYVKIEKAVHTLASGRQIECVRMEKTFT